MRMIPRPTPSVCSTTRDTVPFLPLRALSNAFRDLPAVCRGPRRSQRGTCDPIEPSDRAWLEACFAPHDARLAAHLGRDPDWSS